MPSQFNLKKFNDKQFEIKWIYCVLKGWGSQIRELIALEWEGKS